MSPVQPRARNSSKAHADRPSEIAPGVFVGGWKDALRFEGTRFCVLDEPPPDMPPATHVPIYDESAGGAVVPNLDRLARSIREARKSGQPVLVFCGHGVRRSPLAGAWFLHRTEGISLDAAYERVRAVRPKIEDARSWVENVAELERA